MEKQTIEFINQIFDANTEIGNLLSVEYAVYLHIPKIIEAVVLNFENQVFTIKAVADDDTVELIPGTITINSEQDLVSVSENKPWSMAIGKRITWSWALINQQGYPDAIQFEFGKNYSDELITTPTDSSDKSVMIQLVAAASSILIYELSEIVA